MKTFADFIDLPKEELTRILRIGMEFDFQDAYIKTKGDFVELRSTVTKKPNGRYAYGPLKECGETLHIDPDFNVCRMVYYKGETFNQYDEVRNQVKLFKELQRLGYI